jgi:hypothetical protein
MKPGCSSAGIGGRLWTCCRLILGGFSQMLGRAKGFHLGAVESLVRNLVVTIRTVMADVIAPSTDIWRCCSNNGRYE